MNPEIENLINMALADGEVTEKERAIILRKAESLGLDQDEIEMILDGKIALMKKGHAASTAEHQIPKSNKEGDLKKCPSCGAHVVSFSTKCSDCGNEFRNIDSSNSIKDFFNRLQLIVDEESNRKQESTGLDKLIGGDKPWLIEQKIVQRQIPLISSFPIPNSKEDILEFLSMSLPEATKKLGFFAKISGSIDSHKGELKKAYFSKCEQIIMKARFSMKEDKKNLENIEYYAKQLGIK
jgi:hypothetical protein